LDGLNALDWAAGLCFTSHGLRVGIRSNDGAVLDLISRRLPPGSKHTSSPRVRFLYSVIRPESPPNGRDQMNYRIYAGAELIGSAASREDIVDSLASALDFGVALGSPDKIFVHAGVVSVRNAAVVIPGRSHSGKTTLVEALVRAGATYYSEEYAVLDKQGRVHAYPRPLFLRSTNGGASRRVTVEEIGGRVGKRPLPVALVLLTTYEAGATWRPCELSPGNALLGLLDNTVTARTRTEAVLPALRRAVTGARVLSGSRGEATEVAHAILKDLRTRESGRIEADNAETPSL
jgi:hypothetical protein